MDNIDNILTDLYLEGNTYEYQNPPYESVIQAKLALLEIIKGVKPMKKEESYCEGCAGENYGFNQGVEATMKAITDLFNREV